MTAMAPKSPDQPGLAVWSPRSRGRRHEETFPSRTDPFEIDRRRIVRCAAFRRLQYKTQVFVNHAGDHFRTRMTHTLEVVQVARSLAAALGVNATLTEVACLAHDLGHPPFGHAGEQALHALMADHGGFEHNLHALRVVDLLEHPYPAFRGLNLSFEVRECMVKHRTPYDHPAAGTQTESPHAELLAAGPCPPLEGQIACLADQIAYLCHDLEDAIGAGLVAESDLLGVTLWRQAAEPVRRAWPDHALPAIARPILDELLERLLCDAVEQTKAAVAAANVTTADAVRAQPGFAVGFSAKLHGEVDELRAFLRAGLYEHHRLVRMDEKARRLVAALFEAYVRNPRLMPPRFAGRLDDPLFGGPHRVIGDYIAGMPDRFCQTEYSRLFDPFTWE